MKSRALLLARAFSGVIALMLAAELYARGQGALVASLAAALGFAAVYAIGLALIRRMPTPPADPILEDPRLPPLPRRDPDRQSGRRRVSRNSSSYCLPSQVWVKLHA